LSGPGRVTPRGLETPELGTPAVGRRRYTRKVRPPLGLASAAAARAGVGQRLESPPVGWSWRRPASEGTSSRRGVRPAGSRNSRVHACACKPAASQAYYQIVHACARQPGLGREGVDRRRERETIPGRQSNALSTLKESPGQGGQGESGQTSRVPPCQLRHLQAWPRGEAADGCVCRTGADATRPAHLPRTASSASFNPFPLADARRGGRSIPVRRPGLGPLKQTRPPCLPTTRWRCKPATSPASFTPFPAWRSAEPFLYPGASYKPGVKIHRQVKAPSTPSMTARRRPALLQPERLRRQATGDTEWSLSLSVALRRPGLRPLEQTPWLQSVSLSVADFAKEQRDKLRYAPCRWRCRPCQ
jgi:hypothetical protein